MFYVTLFICISKCVHFEQHKLLSCFELESNVIYQITSTAFLPLPEGLRGLPWIRYGRSEWVRAISHVPRDHHHHQHKATALHRNAASETKTAERHYTIMRFLYTFWLYSVDQTCSFVIKYEPNDHLSMFLHFKEINVGSTQVDINNVIDLISNSKGAYLCQLTIVVSKSKVYIMCNQFNERSYVTCTT